MDTGPCDDWEDPIIAELDAYREQRAAQFNHDIVRMLQDVESREKIPIREQIASWGIEPIADPVPLPDRTTPWEDPIIAELDAYREQHAARFDYDPQRIIADIHSR
jgi:hypothetical protein